MFFLSVQNSLAYHLEPLWPPGSYGSPITSQTLTLKHLTWTNDYWPRLYSNTNCRNGFDSLPIRPLRKKTHHQTNSVYLKIVVQKLMNDRRCRLKFEFFGLEWRHCFDCSERFPPKPDCPECPSSASDSLIHAVTENRSENETKIWISNFFRHPSSDICLWRSFGQFYRRPSFKSCQWFLRFKFVELL